jgi:class 3 adenylate cyclase/tetratricopeptide (TPR) repeat protein
MICPACHHENPERAKFCLECGTRLFAACPHCGTELPPEAKFCLECGQRVAAPEVAPAPGTVPAAPGSAAGAVLPLPDYRTRLVSYTPKHLAEKILKSRSALEGERRQVTVLFADLAGFTTLAEHLDPEEVHRIIERCFELITAEVHRFEGTINQYTGDGVMALFGAPIAHEDAPRRAVHAALGIQRALRDFSTEREAAGSQAVRMRIGLNTGPVVVGRIGDDLRMDYTAVGDTTNLAARMQQVARPDSVLASEATHKAVAGFFDTLNLGEIAVKGHAPVRAFEILRPRGRRSRLDVAAERGLTPLVGRARELGTLAELFAQVKGGRGQVVFIVGEAGVGKSRLLLEFRRTLVEGGENVTWLEGQCASFGQSIPFLPLIDQLRKNFGIEEFDGEPEIIAKIEHGMRRMGELEDGIPYVRSLLSVDPGDPAVVAMDALARRRKSFEAVRRMAFRGARVRPLVLVFEDLHWIDSSTEEYLASVMDSLAGMPIMLVLTHRIGYVSPFGARSFHTTLNLQTLSEPEVVSMASGVLGTEALPRELIGALLEKAEGVPLFVEEVTKTLLDLGVLQRENGGYRMTKGAGEMRVPDTIQGIIMARLDRLGENGKRTVQLASVIGRQFLVRLLERIADLRGELEGLLGELKSLEIIYEQGLLPEPAYIFKHAVIQDVAYQSLLVQRRKELHRAVGRAIEELYPDRLADHYEELAHHFWQGEQWDKALDYLVKSGEKAKLAYANQVALDYFARALEVVSRVEPRVPLKRIVDLHEQRSQIYIGISRYPEAIVEAERMVELTRAAGERRGEGEALAQLASAHWSTMSADHVPDVERLTDQALAVAREAGDDQVLVRALALQGLVRQMHGDLTGADEKLAEAVQICETRGFRNLAVTSRVFLGAHVEWRGEFPQALRLLRHAEQEAREAWDGFNELFAIAFRCKVHIAQGDHADGLAAIADGFAKAKDRDNKYFVGRFENTTGWLHQELGDFARALEHDRQGADIGKQIKNGNVEISSLINIGFDHLHLGEPAKALALLEETQRRAEAGFGAHRWRWEMHVAAYLAEALIELGRPGEAASQIERSLAAARATNSAKYIARGHALRGDIALGAGEWARAESELAEALGLSRRMGYSTLVWQSAHALSRAMAARSEHERGARDRMAQAYEMARLADDTIQSVASRMPDEGLRTAFLSWTRVRSVQDDLDRLRRA